jgi:pimeloyl-ACP methyl ester carboxylesterase/class 3 adenylate cyclase
MDVPDTFYVKTPDGISVAYQVVGDGPVDLLFIPGYQSNLELNWDLPAYAAFLTRLASFSRLIIMDRRGTGLSDALAPDQPPCLEVLIGDLRCVLGAVGSERAVVAGFLDGGYLCTLFAATHPEQTQALILYGTSASGRWSPDYPWQWQPAEWETFIDDMATGWGRQEFADRTLQWYAPSVADDAATRRWWARYQWLSASPGAAVALERLYAETDVRDVLPSIQCPTLVLHRTGDQAESVDGARFIAGRIPGAALVELPGVDNPPWAGDADAIADEIEAFVTGCRRLPDANRVLATVLFTDIVDSTASASRAGDRAWRGTRERHDAIVRAQLALYRGREVKTTGDGFLATFDGPARGVQCAQTIVREVRSLGIEVRAGLHIGELEFDGDDVSGIAVAIGARVSALARGSEVLVSQTIKDLTAGSGIVFADRGQHQLKGIPDSWRIYQATG